MLLVVGVPLGAHWPLLKWTHERERERERARGVILSTKKTEAEAIRSGVVLKAFEKFKVAWVDGC